jgi:hypothetical protein
VLAFDDPTREEHSVGTDLLQVAAPHRDKLADFGVGSVVGEYDVLVPNKLTLLNFNLLRSGKNMYVLRRGK